MNADNQPTLPVPPNPPAATLGKPEAATANTGEPRVRTLLRSMIHAFDRGDSDTYWMTLGMLNTLHREMVETWDAPSVGAAPSSDNAAGVSSLQDALWECAKRIARPEIRDWEYTSFINQVKRELNELIEKLGLSAPSNEEQGEGDKDFRETRSLNN